MITIPPEILALIKSRQQIGANRPTAVIEFGGQPSTASLKNPNEWTTWRIFTTGDRGHGNICETSDGRAVVAYTSNADKSVNVAFAPTVPGVLDGTETFAVGAAVKLASGYADIQPRCSINLVNGKLRLIVYYYNAVTLKYAGEYWADSDGRGLDLAKVSDISLDLGYDAYSAGGIPTLVEMLSNGKLAVLMPYWTSGTLRNMGNKAFSSSNDGLTWDEGAIFNPGSINWITSLHSRNFFSFSDASFLTLRTASTTNGGGLYWTNSGDALQRVGWIGDYRPYGAAWERVDDKIYMVYTRTGVDNPYGSNPCVVLEYIGPEPVTPQSLVNTDNYQLIKDIKNDVGIDDSQHFLLKTKDALILQGSSAGQISGAGTMVSTQSLKPKLVTISRSKGSASQLSCSFANTNGQYAPDPTGPWNFVMWPNNSIVAKLGYGQYLPQVFAGYPDDVRMETPPQMISITARDRSKLALDQICQWTWDGVTYYDGAWAAQAPETIATALFTMAGFAAADIIVDVTGLVTPEFRFNQQTYADLLQSLAEKNGCEWYCDEQGKGYFVLVEYPPATPAYEFVAGVDIFSLGYTISDAEIYRDVIVTAQDADGNTVSAKATWSAADYYGLPAHKTLLVTASDIVQTEAGCLELANKLLTAMTTKPRQVEFVATGLPNLQIGDCIKVTEASSTISEIYRVYEFEHQFDAEGSPVFATAIRCYWYAHG